MKPLLDASYQASLFTGPLGTAMVPKVAANMLCCVGIVAMGELLMVGEGNNSSKELPSTAADLSAGRGNKCLYSSFDCTYATRTSMSHFF